MNKKRNNLIESFLLKINVETLPKQLKELIELIGPVDTYTFLCHYGGKIKYIAKNPSRTEMKHVMNETALKRLCANYGGSTIEVPKQEHLDRQVRNKLIKNASMEGVSRSQLATRFNLSVRHIGNIKK
ncbi:Mor transcription activator family protein [Aliivibrio sp. EL58]|jgi:hypothetical protein|uniref:Mor transcription activator family protein n=1 Tax=Aliivibrio sp. EL58 TaxID=2107582 RepID=UPI000EFB247B|nr:Mor transcription activator family protein [Aliivibrio sp. EL58]